MFTLQSLIFLTAFYFLAIIAAMQVYSGFLRRLARRSVFIGSVVAVFHFTAPIIVLLAWVNLYV